MGIKDASVIATVEFSRGYVLDRFLSDKAIYLIDETALELRIEIDSIPEELDEPNRKIIQTDTYPYSILF
ncbi:MAG: hypothetical protein QM536_02635 [Chitinophagaceae bacterium]|nr:hypothetical protein [Chitinophagaceae bacterium]